MSIPLLRPSIKRSDMDSVLTCMVSDSLGSGALAQRLVRDLSEYLGVEGGMALREYRRAVDCAVDALGLGAGSRVILSPLSPRVYRDVLEQKGIVPVYVDVEMETGCIDPGEIEKLTGQEIGAVIVHATLGYSPDMQVLMDFGVPVLEDISHALGAHNGSRRLGSYGDYVVLSMEPEGIVTSGGGAVLLGRGRKEAAALTKISSTLSADLLLSDLNAALGITQVRKLNSFLQRRREIAAVFTRAVMQSRHGILAQKAEGENVNFSFPVLLDSGMKDVQAYARKKGVETRPAFTDSALAGLSSEEGDGLPKAKALMLRCLLFPLYPTLTTEGIRQIERTLASLP